MRDKHWIFVVNHLDEKQYKLPPLYTEKFPVVFELYDDDGNLYFTGRMTRHMADSHAVLDPLDYAEQWGCTEMRINGVTI